MHFRLSLRLFCLLSAYPGCYCLLPIAIAIKVQHLPNLDPNPRGHVGHHGRRDDVGLWSAESLKLRACVAY
jgi:hypothetical protein